MESNNLKSTMSKRYQNKLILAPMVRICTLPMRLLALEYGADLVYSEELIDYRLLKCRRVQNEILGTVDYLDEKGVVVFRTCAEERDKLVLQLGTCDPERALQVAKFVRDDISAIDINMGCPKEFSIKGGMGAALLSQPDKIQSILTSLVRNLDCPVTCKIRVLPEVESTLQLARIIQDTGVAALAVHGRTISERPQHSNRNSYISHLTQNLSLPIIANGGSAEIKTYQDIEKFRQETGASSVMLARAAEKNCSIFCSERQDDLDTLITKYLRLAIKYDNCAANTKYCIQQMLGSLQDSGKGRRLLASWDLPSICEIWGLKEEYDIHQSIFQERLHSLKRGCDLTASKPKRRKVDDGHERWEMDIKFFKKLYQSHTLLPKTVLHNWAQQCDTPPSYQTIQKDKTFYTEVTVNGEKYANSLGEKNKKLSEQAAALVAGIVLGLIKPDEDIVEKSRKFYMTS